MTNKATATLKHGKSNSAPTGLGNAAQRAWRTVVSGSIAGNGLMAICDQAIVSGTSFAGSIILGRFGSVTQLGAYFLAMRLINLAKELQTRAISAPYAVFCHRRPAEELPSYSGNTLAHQLGASSAVGLGLLACGLYLAVDARLAEYRGVVLAAALAAPAVMMHDFVRQFTFAHQQMRRTIVIDLGISFVQILGLILLVWMEEVHAAAALLVIGIACLAGWLGWAATRQQPLRIECGSLLPDWLRNWSFAKWALFSKLIGEWTPYLIPCLLTWAHGVEATGVFAACATTVGFANVFVGGLGRFLCASAPRVYCKQGLEALRRLLLRAALLFAATVGLLTVLMFWQGNLALTIVFGEAYGGQGPILGILALGILANSISVVVGNGIWAVEKPRANIGADVATTATSLLLAGLLIAPWGVGGAALASTAGLIVGGGVRCYILHQLLKTLEHQRQEASYA